MSTALQPRFGPATLVPFGLGSAHPIAWMPVARAAWDNRHALGDAMAALATPCTCCSTSGVHLCRARLEALVDLHRPALVPFDVRDTQRLRALSAPELRALGRIRTPLRRTRRGLEALSWDEALEIAAPSGTAVWSVAARGLSDEVLAEIGRVGEALELESDGPLPHAVATDELTEAERIVIWGVPVHERSPDLLRSLARARRAGVKVIAVGSHEAQMDAHRFPNTLRAAIFGEAAIDSWFHSEDPLGVARALASSEPTAGGGLARGRIEQLRSELAVMRCVSIVGSADPDVVALHEARGWTGVGAGLLRVARGHGVEAASHLGLHSRSPGEADWCAFFGQAPRVRAARRVFADTHLRPEMLEEAEQVVILPIQPISSQRGGAWISADCRIFSSRTSSRYGGTRARAAYTLPSQLIAAADPARAGEIPNSIADVRERLADQPAYANTTTLQPGGWAWVPRA